MTWVPWSESSTATIRAPQIFTLPAEFVLFAEHFFNYNVEVAAR